MTGRIIALIMSDTTIGYTDSEIDELRKKPGSTRSAIAPGGHSSSARQEHSNAADCRLLTLEL